MTPSQRHAISRFRAAFAALLAAFFGPFRRKPAVPHAKHRLSEVEVRRRRRQAEAWRSLAWDSPPLSEWEVMAMYGVVEAERRGS